MKLTLKSAPFRCVVGMLCVLAVVSDAIPENPPATGPDQASTAAKIPPDQLDSLVAPIALYPDPLLAQTLAASTYPLEIIQLQQWLEKNPTLKDQALVDAVAKEPWDPSVQSMAALPDVAKRLAGDIQWTTDLGNAFLAQESDVMEAVQRMRKKAESTGNLKSTEQQKVETKVVEDKSVIVVEQADPQVIYVPSYNPTVVYGAPIYPYPSIYYPVAGAALTFGVGVAMGAAFSGGWGYNAGWGGNNVNINNYNNFNRNANVNRNTNVRGGNSNWSHNPQHRGGAPYRDAATAGRYGGSAGAASVGSRQAGAQQQLNRQGGNVASNRPSGGAGAGDRPGGAGAGTAARPSGGADRIGGQELSRGTGGSGNAFGGGSRGYNGSSTRAAGSRGASSMGARGGGRGGGGRRR